MAETTEYQPTAVLLTGGAGFICSHVCNFMTEEYPAVKFVCLDVLEYCANMKNIEASLKRPNFVFVQGNILNIELVSFIMRTHRIDTIMHFAAQSHVDKSFGNSFEFTQTNIMGTHVLLECAKQFKVGRFIHVSTDEVYGEVLSGRADEMSLLLPTNPYACSKAAAEFMCQAYIRSFNLPIIITRGNNVFGPHQFPEKVVPKFIHLLRAGRKCCLHGGGQSLRNFLHTSDAVRAFDIILRKGKLHEIYNVGTDVEVSVRDLALKLAAVMKLPGRPEDWIEEVKDRAFNDARYLIDSTKLQALGWTPDLDFDGLLADTVKWYLEHLDWWPQEVTATYLSPHPIAYVAKAADLARSLSKVGGH